MTFDVVIVGGGPAGLSAALALGRARKRVLLCDAGLRRNAAATHIHNFVTRDGTPPDDFRHAARQDLARYSNVELRDVGVVGVSGARGEFQVELGSGTVPARRVLLCAGMIDDMLPIEGYAELWGQSIFQCPYCHGWEVQDRAWGYLARFDPHGHFLLFAQQLRAWTRKLVLFTNGTHVLPDGARQTLEAAGIELETNSVTRLIARDGRLVSVALEDGRTVPCEALFSHPPQRQIDLVRDLDLELDDDGYVKVDPVKRETSIPGIYAAGDLATRMQGAILAAASGTQAAVVLNLDLTMDLAPLGLL
jgi:thioredoxin reductase